MPIELPLLDQPPERRDAADNRRRILDAARATLGCTGAAGLSMNAVASAAGVGKGTIFRRFGDRDGLLAALLDQSAAELQNAFLHGPPPLGPGAPAPERLEAFVLALVRFHHEQRELVLAAERHATATPRVNGTFLVHMQGLIEEIDPRLNATVVARLLLNAVAPAGIGRLRDELDVSVADVQAGALALLRGLTRPA